MSSKISFQHYVEGKKVPVPTIKITYCKLICHIQFTIQMMFGRRNTKDTKN